MDTKEKEKLLLAANTYVDLQARRINPQGAFDKSGRFHLENHCPCCNVRTPSRNHPYQEMVHGRTAIHVANEFGVNPLLVKKIAKYMVK